MLCLPSSEGNPSVGRGQPNQHGHGSKSRTPSEHPNLHKIRLMGGAPIPKLDPIRFDPQPHGKKHEIATSGSGHTETHPAKTHGSWNRSQFLEVSSPLSPDHSRGNVWKTVRRGSKNPPEDGFWGVKGGLSTSLEGTKGPSGVPVWQVKPERTQPCLPDRFVGFPSSTFSLGTRRPFSDNPKVDLNPAVVDFPKSKTEVYLGVVNKWNPGRNKPAHRSRDEYTNTNTHTHIYIYIYIYGPMPFDLVSPAAQGPTIKRTVARVAF